LLSRYTVTWMIEKEMNETLLVNATYLHCEKNQNYQNTKGVVRRGKSFNYVNTHVWRSFLITQVRFKYILCDKHREMYHV
jgi:hypothetical protein